MLLIINGMYDLMCAFSILYFNKGFFAEIHTNMYKIDSISLLSKRFLAYWIFTNGMVRLFSGIFPFLYIASAITYFIEVFVFVNEFIMDKMKLRNVLFVTVTSFIIGTLLIYASNKRFQL